MDNSKLYLLILAAAISLITEIKEYVPGKRFLRIFTICLIIAVTIMQYHSDREETTTHLKEFNKSIAKADTTLLKIGLAYDTIKAIQKNINMQFIVQKSITKETNLLSKQNEKISKIQQSTFANINRILNPLFPLNIQISYQISFEEPNLKGLTAAIYKLNSNPDFNLKNTTYYVSVDNKHNGVRIINPDSVLTGDALDCLYKLYRHEISFLLFSGIMKRSNTLSPQINFFLNPEGKFSYKYFSIDADIENKTFDVEMQYNDYEPGNNPSSNSVDNIGFNDLLNSYVLFDKERCFFNIKGLKINFSSKNNVNNGFEVSFGVNDVVDAGPYVSSLNGVSNCKIYARKITLLDKENPFFYVKDSVVFDAKGNKVVKRKMKRM